MKPDTYIAQKYIELARATLGEQEPLFESRIEALKTIGFLIMVIGFIGCIGLIFAITF